MCIWTLDIGNTTAKLVLFADNFVRKTIVLNTQTIINDLVGVSLGNSDLIYCSVVPNINIEKAVDKIDVHRATFECIPINIDYLTRKTLGEDRVFAAYGALQKFNSEQNSKDSIEYLIVIDAGTAITCDIVHIKRKSFLGGAILSGESVLADSLKKMGAQIPAIINDSSEFSFPAKSTNDSIRSGLFAQMSGAISYIIGLFLHSMSLQKENIQIYITGGNRDNIRLEYECKREQYLVNFGLLQSYLYTNPNKK